MRVSRDLEKSSGGGSFIAIRRATVNDQEDQKRMSHYALKLHSMNDSLIDYGDEFDKFSEQYEAGKRFVAEALGSAAFDDENAPPRAVPTLGASHDDLRAAISKAAKKKRLGLLKAAACGEALCKLLPDEAAPKARRSLRRELRLSSSREWYCRVARLACARYGRFLRLRKAAASERELRRGLADVLLFLDGQPREELVGVWGWDGTWGDIPQQQEEK